MTVKTEVSAHQPWGSVFAGYRNMVQPLDADAESEVIARVVFDMCKHLKADTLPGPLRLVHSYCHDYRNPLDVPNALLHYEDALTQFRGSENDIVQYHLFGLLTHEMIRRQVAMNSSPDRVLISQNLLHLWGQIDNNMMTVGAGNITEKDTLFANSVASTRNAGEAFSDILLIENPSSLDPVLNIHRNGSHFDANCMLGFVHGRPFAFANTPLGMKGDYLIFDPHRVSVRVPLGQTIGIPIDETCAVLPMLPVSSDEHVYYAALNSRHRKGHIARHELPAERTKAAYHFAEDVLAPMVQNDYGLLLTEQAHMDGLLECYNGNFEVHDLLSRRLAREAEAAERVRALEEYYAGEDVGMF